MSYKMSRRCHALLVNSHDTTLRSTYQNAISDIDYAKYFTKNLRAVAVDGAGKTDFLVLGLRSEDGEGYAVQKCCRYRHPICLAGM